MVTRILLSFLVFAGGNALSAAAAPGDLMGSKAGVEREIAGVKLCWCPPGKFTMGSPRTEPGHRPDEGPVEVTLTRGFWAAKFEATQGEWRRVVGKLPGVESGVGDAFPLCDVNYPEALEFCQKLTEQGRKDKTLPAHWEFRLPSEAEWEYACRAGTTTATAFGDSLTSKQANFALRSYNTDEQGPSLKHATKVGSYPANAWGLHDMHGNMFEWTRDWYHARLPGGTDPDLSTKQGERNRDGTYSRVRRGGAFVEEGWPNRSACRIRYEPQRRSDHIGFRVIVAQVTGSSTAKP
jgi:formylglycine-generating enzyme required for sulfatase activity